MFTLYPITNSNSSLIIPTIDITEGALLAVGIRIKPLESNPFLSGEFSPVRNHMNIC